MNTKKTVRNRKTESSLINALAKGALIWGPVYSIGASTTAYWTSKLTTDYTPAYGDIVSNALMIFPLLTIVGSGIKWRVLNPANGKNKTHRKMKRRNRRKGLFSGSRSFGLRPKHA